ncbi:hypothetical protein H2202_005597 [Exophiala xenobiotica]|nr:hypothetical protein H2202_005597 [Exophiala xenobiotica]
MSDSTNATIWAPNYGAVTHINCVYPISGTYGLLPRLLFYVTLVAAIFGRSREWLIIGALVSALTYAGTAAIHMMTLVRSRAGVFDLDIMTTWAILSTGALGYIGMMHWSTTLRNSRAKVVMILWGILVGTGLIFGRALLFDTPLSPSEPACYSSSTTEGEKGGKLLEWPVELISAEFNCTYKCFGLSRPLRHRSEIQAVPHRMLDNRYTQLALVLVGPIQFAAYAAISLDSLEHTPSVMCQRYVMAYLLRPDGNGDGHHGHTGYNNDRREEMTKVVYKASMESWYGGYFVLVGYVRRVRWSWMKVLWASLLLPWLMLSFAIDVLCLPLMVTNIVLNEVTLLSGGFPVNEADVAIGQWGPVVSACLVVIAACVNKGLEWWEVRQRRRRESRMVDVDVDVGGAGEVEEGVVRVGFDAGEKRDEDEDEEEDRDGEGQTVGVVKPKLAHVQTLRDMEDWMRPK